MRFLLKTLAVLCIVLGAYLPSAQAAVTLDAAPTAACTAKTATITCSNLTIGSGSNEALIVVVGYNAGAAATAITGTWDGTQSLTLLGNTYVSSQFNGTAILCLAGATSGKNTLSVTITATSLGEDAIAGISFLGVNQTTPCQNYASAGTSGSTGTTGSITVTSSSSDAVAAIEEQGQQNTDSVNNTSMFPILVGAASDNTYSGNYALPAASSTTMSATGGGSATWAISGIDVQAAGASVAVPHNLTLLGVGQ